MKYVAAGALFIASLVLANFAAQVLNPVTSLALLGFAFALALSAVAVLREKSNGSNGG